MKMRIRKNNQNLWVPMLSEGVSSPRFAVRYGGQNYYAPLATSAGKPCLAVKVNGSTKYLKLQNSYLTSWLKFDESATKDMCGNVWTANSSATLTTDNAVSGKALTDGTVTLDGTIALGGQDFTVDFWFKRAASSFYPHVFLWRNGESATGGAGGLFGLEVDPNGRLYLWNAAGSSFSVDYNTTQTTHCAFVYQHASGTLKVYLDGVLKATQSVTIARTAYTAQLLCYSNHILYVDEFRVFDGIAKWTSDFTPPTASDY